jgi:hypothetical protein
LSRFARKVDDNQAGIVAALRKLGFWVWPTHALGNGAPDVIVCRPRDKAFVWLEIKDGRKPPSARKLTEDEENFHAKCPGPVYVVGSLDEALVVLK